MPASESSQPRHPWITISPGAADKLAPGQSRSFVLKLWVESLAQENTPPIWRGYITRVADRTTLYFQNLDEVSTYLYSQLAEMLGEVPTSSEN